LHRLESEGWVIRKNSAHDRRCKIVHLGPRAHRVIAQINAAASELREELLTDIPLGELRTCMRVLTVIRDRAEAANGIIRARRNGVGVRIDGNGRS
jgi:DNA-binding MarR family transcriptional regulator